MQEVILGVLFTQLCYLIYRVAKLESNISKISNHITDLTKRIERLEEKCKK